MINVKQNKKNGGFAKGYNDALQNINADIYGLINSDIEVTENWLSPIISTFEKEPSTAIIQPKILDFKKKTHFEYAGGAGGFIDKFGYPFCRGRIFDTVEEDRNQYDDEIAIFWASGACFFIRATIFKSLNGFDEDYFAHQEEIDLCWRIQLKGYKIYCCPSSTVFHVGAGTLPRGGRKVYLNFRNNLVMLCKNLPLIELLWKLPLRLSLDALSAWKGLLTGDGSFFTAIVKAHFSLFGFLIQGKVHRSDTVKSMAKLDGVYTGSLVYQYFIKKRHYFNKIVQ